MIQETKTVYSVWEITRLIRKEIEPKFENVWISGELSNVKLTHPGICFLVIYLQSSEGSFLSLEFFPCSYKLYRKMKYSLAKREKPMKPLEKKN